MAVRHLVLISLFAVSTVSAIAWLGVLKGAWQAKETIVAGVDGAVQCVKGVKNYFSDRKEASNQRKQSQEQYALDVKRTDLEQEKAKFDHAALQDRNDVERLRIHGEVARAKMGNAKEIEIAGIEANSRNEIAQKVSDVSMGITKLATFGFIVHRGLQCYDTYKYNELELARTYADVEKQRLHTERVVAQSAERQREAVTRANEASAKEQAEMTERSEKAHATEKEKIRSKHKKEERDLKSAIDDNEATISEKDASTRQAKEDLSNDIDQHEHRMSNVNKYIDNLLGDAVNAIGEAQQINPNMRYSGHNVARIARENGQGRIPEAG